MNKVTTVEVREKIGELREEGYTEDMIATMVEEMNLSPEVKKLVLSQNLDPENFNNYTPYDIWEDDKAPSYGSGYFYVEDSIKATNDPNVRRLRGWYCDPTTFLRTETHFTIKNPIAFKESFGFGAGSVAIGKMIPTKLCIDENTGREFLGLAYKQKEFVATRYNWER